MELGHSASAPVVQTDVRLVKTALIVLQTAELVPIAAMELAMVAKIAQPVLQIAALVCLFAVMASAQLVKAAHLARTIAVPVQMSVAIQYAGAEKHVRPAHLTAALVQLSQTMVFARRMRIVLIVLLIVGFVVSLLQVMNVTVFPMVQ
jgi:hypothetical protein